MYPQNLIRALFSAPKKIFQDSDPWLDLSYITPRVIVAAGPTDKRFWSAVRTPIGAVVDHLNQNYKSNDVTYWHIWNLRHEGAGYGRDLVRLANWTYRPFPDHKPPSLTFLRDIVSEISQFITESPKNVALIHCKEGKGRSGTVCCGYLMYEARLGGIFMSAEEANHIFTQGRMRGRFGPGVSTKSQFKYLKYWQRYLLFSRDMVRKFDRFHQTEDPMVPYNPKRSRIQMIRIYEPFPFLVVSDLKIHAYKEKEKKLALREVAGINVGNFLQIKTPLEMSKAIVEIPLDVPISANMKDLQITVEKRVCFAYTWLNLFFETMGASVRSDPDGLRRIEQSVLIEWEDFDGLKGTSYHAVGQLFRALEVVWLYEFDEEIHEF